MSNNYIIYVLHNTLNNLTYVGITNNPTRRLRQHNGDLVGGAKYTTSKKGLGEWKYYGWIESTDILIKNRALSLEKRIQLKSRKLSGTPIERRLKAIDVYLQDNLDLIFKINN
jgi:predicted GIY-YIG superfamily endonuclease